MGAGLMCSGAMGLPVSGFPNMQVPSLDSDPYCRGHLPRINEICSLWLQAADRNN